MDLYKGRFNNKTSNLAHEFNSSITVDYKLYKYDIMGSKVHAKMLEKCGIISKSDYKKIKEGLDSILEDIQNGVLEFSIESEDIHMFVEEQLTKRIGEAGKKLHTARSRNDQVALDIKLYIRDKTKKSIGLLLELEKTIIRLAKDNLNTIMPGYTHLQIAQPVTYAHNIMAYAQMILRDIKRLDDSLKSLDASPLGSCALAATTYPIDREFTARELGFTKPTLNSMDSVSDRDHVIEFINILAMSSMHFSRLAEEMIIYSSQEFRFIEIADEYSSGSSIMPQKKNPDMAELIRAKAARLNSNLIGILTVLKATPLSYNKDLQEDKYYLFDSFENFEITVKILIGMLSTLKVNKNRMLEMAHKGYINATDTADYLVKKGLAFRDAYYITGSIVNYAIENDLSLNEINLETYKNFSEVFDEDYYQYIDLKFILEERDVFGGPSPNRVKEQIKLTEQELKAFKIHNHLE
ncbi:argininosuccinate lyase [Peptoniphilus olsenii]|uniref:Argininosuccinate lyase n=1 Tax=Peptoniphilus olsenii TaxID=411570 RepID=A0ABV2JBF7_9FIRM